jgi:DNA polymerase elongation subunit (family B)
MTDLIFQILDWDHYHEEDDEGNKHFIGRLFGKTKDNKSIYLRVNDFNPFFYVELDSRWRQSSVMEIINKVKERVWPKEYANGLKGFKVVEKHKFYGFTNFKKFSFLQLIFKSYDAMKAFDRVFYKKFYIPSISRKPIKFNVFESNIYPMLRLMHIRQLDAVGWVKIEKNKYKLIGEDDMCQTSCEINASCKWTQLEKVDDNNIQKFIIAAFDIECTSEDGAFPNPQRAGDEVIQIGITLSRFGEDECYYKHIITLKKTVQLEGIVVEWYNTEEEVLIAFSNLIRKLDPDVITGYNIFGFDFEYLMKRSKKLGIYPKFSRMSRINNEVCEFVLQTLSSSGLGDNILKYYKMTGRVIIDLMKVVQRDFKLPSYKLDDVASYFIREAVQEFIKVDNDKTLIKTRSTNGIYLDQFVRIGYNDGITENKHMEGKKFKVLAVEQDSILIDGLIETEDIWGKGYKIFWCQAKDDVKPQEIFDLQKGSPKDRGIIAKYCVQDSSLCNKLMSKLQILTNNIGMANVCNVPLSYLFLRGQGVKIFSLVSKKCRIKEHLIPVIRKKFKKDPTNEPDPIQKITEYNERYLNNKHKDEEEDEEDEVGYEGATVFEPKTGVQFEPVPVLDFASLYPNAMILRNLSHEMFINDTKYDGLPGYRYHVIEYRNNDNTTTLCKFAEKIDGTKGIIPEILTDLLTARKRYRTMAEETKDPFLKSILDGLQLAFKVTANSLYGQTGAPTSSIYMKEIAASTTATGREMLQYSKYFIEHTYADLIKLALLGDKKMYMDTIKKQYENYPHKIKLDDGTFIHVHTDEAFKIPDSRFVKYEIGYNVKNDMFDKYTSVFASANFKDAKDTVNRFFKVLNSIGYFERTKFYKHLTKAIDDDKYSNKFFDDNKDVLCKMELDIHLTTKFLTTLKQFDNKEAFMSKLNEIIDNMGTINRDELFEKFYHTMKKLLDGYTLKPEIIYGDSVVPDTPILLRYLDKTSKKYVVVVKTIDTLTDKWKSYEQFKSDDKTLLNKQQCESIDYEVWTDKGWSKIKRVIRHKTQKKIYEVLTHTGCVRVTEDHSLVKSDMKLEKPKDVKIGDELLHSFPKDLFTEKIISSTIPESIINGTIHEKELFIKKHYDINECKMNITSQMSAMNMYCLLKSMNYNVSINKRADEPEIFRLTYSKNKFRKSATAIKKITEVKQTYDYVYDLETECGRFHAGVGELIVKNTDSVFFVPHVKDLKTGLMLKDKKGLEICIILGIWGSIMITTLIPPPMAQEYEKVLWPFVIITKKRYVGNLYEKDPNKFYQKSMGIVLKRRDNAPIVKVVCGGIIDQILNKRSAEGAVKLTRENLKKIITDKFPLDKYIITKTLRGTYSGTLKHDKKENGKIVTKAGTEGKWFWSDVKCSIAHVALCQRMAERDPGNKPAPNDRIPYLYFETKQKVELQGDRIEHPEYLLKNNLKVDYLFYITNQIMKPAMQFLELIVENPKQLFTDYIIREENRKNGVKPVVSYFEKGDSKMSFDDFATDLANNSDQMEELKPKTRKKPVKKQAKLEYVCFDPIDSEYFNK